MNKIAQKPISSFNEGVPSTDLGMQTAETQGMPQPQKNAVMDPNSDQYAAVPMDQGQQGMENPQTNIPPEMVAAAQAFLGPEVMQAAMQGDPNASDLVARSAAHFGSTFMNMTNQASGMPVPTGTEQQVNDGQAPVGITSPEEDIAAELVPNIPAPQQAVPGQSGIPAGQSPEQPGQVAGTPSTTEGEMGNDQALEQSQGQQTGQQQGLDQNGNPQMVDIATVAKIINLVKAGKI